MKGIVRPPRRIIKPQGRRAPARFAAIARQL
jgi:hypothetical protein